uniref:Uncharacterized protein n=1 Tax=Spongospora subterranea TaxID=70186 RepID=A0A0H5RTM8_9EUKA|eukprot:CRZ12099.1 hypothetical protein [Spongospora subterranea]
MSTVSTTIKSVPSLFLYNPIGPNADGFNYHNVGHATLVPKFSIISSVIIWVALLFVGETPPPQLSSSLYFFDCQHCLKGFRGCRLEPQPGKLNLIFSLHYMLITGKGRFKFF